MPGTTTKWALPYPLGGEGPDGPGGIAALAARIEALNADVPFSYPGTFHDFGDPWKTTLRRSIGTAVLNLGANPGTNNASAESANNLIGSLAGSGIAAAQSVAARLQIFDGGWHGYYADVILDKNDGGLRIAYTSMTTITNGCMICGQITFPIA